MTKAKGAPSNRFNLKYVPNPAQERFSEAISGGAKVVLFLGGRRAGKSVGGIAECIKQVYHYKSKPKLGWIISPTYPMSTTPEAIFKKLVYTDQGSLVLNHRVGDRAYLMKPTADAPRTPFRVEFKSATEPDRLRGSSLSFVLMDEGAMMSQETFRILLACVLDADGLIMITTTPRGKNWLYHDVYLRSLKDPRYATIKTRTDENIYLDKSDVEELRKTYSLGSESWAKQEIEAEFQSFEGMVFTHFDTGSHVIAEKQIPEKSEVICGIDWGWNDPFVCVWLTKLDGVWVCLDEYYKPKGLFRDHADYILNHPLHSKVKRYWCDPSGLQSRKELVELGVKPMFPARKRASKKPTSWPVDRARLINSLFASRMKSPFDETKPIPGLVYFDTIQMGLRETMGLCFRRFSETKTDESGNITGIVVTDKEGRELDKNATEQLEDRNNHFIDALGYAIYSEEGGMLHPPHYKDEGGRVISIEPKDKKEEIKEIYQFYRDLKNPLKNPKPRRVIDPFDTLGGLEDQKRFDAGLE